MILIMEMLIENNNKIDVNCFAKKLKNWVENGRPELGYNKGIGVGNMTFKIVNMPNFIDNPIECSRDVWQGILAPNGSIMRTSIMAFRNLSYENTIRDAITISKTTHYNPRCSISVAVVVSILWDIIYDTDESIILDRARKLCGLYKGTFKSFECNEISYISEAQKYFDMKTLEEMDLNEQIGYCFKSMACAVYSFRNLHTNYKDIILEIILKGGDADSNAAPAGAILGCYQGFKNIPKEWLDKMPNNEWLSEYINKYRNVLDK
jgi:ADP-ribosylglycohydrolase